LPPSADIIVIASGAKQSRNRLHGWIVSPRYRTPPEPDFKPR